MLKKNKITTDIAIEQEKGFNSFVDELNAPEQTLPEDFVGHFWPAQCFSCERKRNQALHMFSMRSMQEKITLNPRDLRTCKVCVKYAMRLSEVRKELKNLERFFQSARRT